VQTALATLSVLWFLRHRARPARSAPRADGPARHDGDPARAALAAFACIAYFHLHGRTHRDAHWFRTLVAPLVGGLGMLYVIWLLVLNAGFAAGTAAGDIVFQLSPSIVALAGLGGVIFALVTHLYPQRYELLGRVVLDVRERRETDTDALQVVRPRSGRHGL
jgi:hypothetical protein